MIIRTLTLWLALASGIFAASDAPAWLRDAAAQKSPQFDKKVTALVLHDESRISVEESGKTTSTTYRAVRILTRDGRGEAFAREMYLTGSGKVKELRAWLIRPSGDVKAYGKDRVLDMPMA